MKSTSDIVLKLLGVLLLTESALNGRQLFTKPVANKDSFTNAFIKTTK
jgi:hypothetical protein